MTDQELQEIFENIYRQVGRSRIKKIEAKFYPYRSLKHTVEWNTWRIRAKVNHRFRNAPVRILEFVSLILIAKVYKLKVDKNVRVQYQEYVLTLAQTLPAPRHNRLDSYQSQGKIYDLSAIFTALNQVYFNNTITMPVLGWSKKNSYRRLGFYDAERNLLVISRIFDNKKIPEEVVRYLVYHEMLHIQYPAQKREGRRLVHTAEFKGTEQNYPRYEEINRWLKSFSRSITFQL